jgi:predicted RNase H-like nuclease (RuvC/YqgF family)
MLLQLLMKIVMMNEALKQQEADMKANCKRQKADLEALLARLKDCPLPADEMQRMLQIEQVYEQELSRLKQLKQLLSKKAQEIQLLRRKIDDVPTRTELVQYVLESLGSLHLNLSTCVRYERRFVELYEQVAGTTDETKKYYTTYNTLQNTKDFILKESKVMDRQDPASAFFMDFSRLSQRLR